MGARQRRRGQRRRPVDPEDRQLLDARPGRRDARRDDAREHEEWRSSQADIIINVPLEAYGSLDWRRSDELIEEGYKAAEAMRDTLLPLAVSEAEYAQWKAARQARRRTALPAPAFVRFEGFSAQRRAPPGGPADARARRRAARRRRARRPTCDELSGLDRYETITWRFVDNPAGETGLLIAATPKPYAPPFLMLGLNLENTTSDDFAVDPHRALARVTTWSDPGPSCGSTPRSDRIPASAVELYKPIGSSPFFVAPYAGIVNRTLRLIQRRRDRREIRRDAQRGRAERRHESRTAERSARRRLRRPARRGRPGRRSGTAGGQRQGNGRRGDLALRHAGQPGRADHRHVRARRPALRLRRARRSRRR